MESYERTNSIKPAGVLATACRQSGPCTTREVPAAIAVWINWQLVREKGRADWQSRMGITEIQTFVFRALG
jgi:hypothetical protein